MASLETCLLDIPDPFKEKNSEGVRYTFSSEKHYMALLQNLELMRQNNILTDVTLVSKEGKQFSLHSVLLAAVGSQFRKMFCTATMQFFKGEIVADKTSSDIIEALVTYVYTPNLLFYQPDTWQDLMDFASSFGMHHMVNSEGDVKMILSVLQELYERHDLTFTKVRVGTEEFYTHAAILVASSPVFKDWIIPDYQTSVGDTIDIMNISAEVVDKLINYVYFAYIDLDMDIVEKVLYGSCRLKYPSVAKACCDLLMSNLEIGNVVWVLNLSKQAREINCDEFCAELCEHSKTYIKQNLKDVILSGKFENIHSKEEIVEFFANENVKTIETKVLVNGVMKWYSHDSEKRLLDALDLFSCLDILINLSGFLSTTLVMRNFMNTDKIKEAVLPLFPETGPPSVDSSTDDKTEHVGTKSPPPSGGET